jgi:hypothetical protein
MTFLPVVERELRLRARSPSAYWWRCSAALAAGALGAVMMVAGLVLGPGQAGRTMFSVMAGAAWLFCLTEGVRNTADCLSEEKRAGTLGLLFLTDLRGHDVVLGKFVGASVGAFLSLLAAFPMIGLAFIHGGVTAGEFWRMCLALTNTLFFTLAASLLSSSVSRRERHAWLGALVVTAAFTAVLPCLSGIASGWIHSLRLASPYTLFHAAFDLHYRANPGDFWASALTVHLLCWLWLGLASFLLPRSWQEKATRPSRGRFFRRQPDGQPTDADRVAQAELRSWEPILWLAIQDRGASHPLGWWPKAVAGTGVALGLVLFLGLGSSRWSSGLIGLWVFGFCLHQVMTAWVAWEACHALGELRRSGLLELLLATPMPVADIVDAHAQALKRQFLGPVALIAATELLILAAAVVMSADKHGYGGVAVLVFGGLLSGGGLTLWLLDLLAVARVGLWRGLTAAKPAQAWGKTIFWVLLAPLPIVLLTMCLWIFVPFFLLAKDFLFIEWANDNLRGNFRLAASGCPLPPKRQTERPRGR